MTNSISREVLKQVLDEVRAYRKSTGDRFAFKLTDAWVYKLGTDHWEFHFGKFYWRGGSDNAFEARAKGWSAWLAAQEGNWHEEDAVSIGQDHPLAKAGWPSPILMDRSTTDMVRRAPWRASLRQAFRFALERIIAPERKLILYRASYPNYGARLSG